jgi:hypothetical protein
MTEHPEIPQQPEDVPGRPIAVTMAATIITIVACVVVVWLLQSRRLEGGGEAEQTRTLELVPPAPPFEVQSDLERVRDAQHLELDTWTWADRDRKIVRVPVDLAIDRYLAKRGAR